MKKLLACLLLLAVILSWNTAYAVQYTYTPLLPPGGTESQPGSINDNGDVALRAGFPGSGGNFIYNSYDASYTELLPYNGGFVRSINNSNDVVGGLPWSEGKGFLYSGGNYVELLPLGWRNSGAADINNNGVVAGFGENASGQDKGFLYKDGVYTEFGSSVLQILAINDNGDVVGRDNYTEGFIYSGGLYTQLLNLYSPHDINNNGDVVGNYVNGKFFIYSNGVYSDLEIPGCYATAESINDKGEVVGWCDNGTGFIYSNGDYTILDNFRPGNTKAYDINNNGEILGWFKDTSVYPYKDMAFIATPVPEPTSLLLLGTGLIGLIGLRRKLT